MGAKYPCSCSCSSHALVSSSCRSLMFIYCICPVHIQKFHKNGQNSYFLAIQYFCENKECVTTHALISHHKMGQVPESSGSQAALEKVIYQPLSSRQPTCATKHRVLGSNHLSQPPFTSQENQPTEIKYPVFSNNPFLLVWKLCQPLCPPQMKCE